MHKKKHFIKRVNQRGIREYLLDLTLKISAHSGDKAVLDLKSIDSVLSELDNVRKNLLKARDKGGMAIVEKNGYLITAYPIHRK